jgi:pimeloyl-ACP methyl ester carboxylesterase
MRELLVPANGLRFHCLADGPEDGPLALLLHGFPESAGSWTAQLPALAAAGYLAVAPDLRGYGGTDRPEGEDAYRMAHLVDDVVGLADALGRERCHLAGHDWGALVGWAVVGRRPERVVTWSALSVGHPQAFIGAIDDDDDQRRRSSYIQLFLQREKAEDVLADDGHRRLRGMYSVGPQPDAISAEHVEMLVRELSRPGRLTAGLNYYRANLGPNRQEMALPPAPIETPTQLIWGDQDPAVGAESAHRTGQHVAVDYRLEVLKGAGHWLSFERPADVSRLLVEWMTAHPGSGAGPGALPDPPAGGVTAPM